MIGEADGVVLESFTILNTRYEMKRLQKAVDKLESDADVHISAVDTLVHVYYSSQTYGKLLYLDLSTCSIHNTFSRDKSCPYTIRIVTL